jgi:hypothetical protein
MEEMPLHATSCHFSLHPKHRLWVGLATPTDSCGQKALYDYVFVNGSSINEPSCKQLYISSLQELTVLVKMGGTGHTCKINLEKLMRLVSLFDAYVSLADSWVDPLKFDTVCSLLHRKSWQTFKVTSIFILKTYLLPYRPSLAHIYLP